MSNISIRSDKLYFLFPHRCLTCVHIYDPEQVTNLSNICLLICQTGKSYIRKNPCGNQMHIKAVNTKALAHRDENRRQGGCHLWFPSSKIHGNYFIPPQLKCPVDILKHFFSLKSNSFHLSNPITPTYLLLWKIDIKINCQYSGRLI